MADEKKANMDSKHVYLQLLQEPIGRMSSMSAIFKGFSAAILAQVVTGSFSNTDSSWVLLGLVPIFFFFCLDVYYFRLEKILRYRFKNVASDQAKIDFSISTKLNKDERKKAGAGIITCLKSPSIWMFYGPLFLVSIGLIYIVITAQ